MDVQTTLSSGSQLKSSTGRLFTGSSANQIPRQVQSNLGNTTTEGTGSKWSFFSGGFICQVWFKNFKIDLYSCPCVSHDISDRWFPRVSGGVMGHIHLRGKWRPRTPRWYNAALTHTKWMGNLTLPTLSSNCEKRRACFRQMSPGMHVWGVLVPIRTVFMRSNWPRG